MTEAELQRLAELLSANQQPSFLTTWGTLISFVLGVLAARINFWLDSLSNRRKILKVARANLLQSLIAYRSVFNKGYLTEKRGARHADDYYPEYRTALDRVKSDLISVDDRYYTKLIIDVLVWPSPSSALEKLEKIDAVIERLRTDTQSLLELMDRDQAEKLTEELLTPPGETSLKRPVWREWLNLRRRR